MIKEEVIASICNDTGYRKYMVEQVIDSLLANITDALSNGDKVQFAGFGTFEPKKMAARIGRNPNTNRPVNIPARIVPAFRAGSNLKNAVIKENNKK